MRRAMIMGLAFGLAVAPAALNAQGGMAARRAGRGPAMNPAERVLAQREALGLTAAQVTQLEKIRDRVQALNKPLLDQLAAARPEAGRMGLGGGALHPRPLMRGRMAPLSAEKRAELRDTAQARLKARRDELSKLTPEQRAQLRDSTKARVHARRPGAPALTAEQNAQLRDTARARVQARRQELQNMTPEQRAELKAQHEARAAELRKQAETVRPLMTQLRQNMETSRKEVESVLTSEQLAKLQSLRGGQRGGRGGALPR